MSVQTEIARIAQAKTDIKNVVNSKVANTITNQTIDAFPPLIDSSIAAYKNLIPWIEGSGSSFAIDNAESGKLDKFEMYGNTHQDSHTGKNLLKNTGTSTTKNGLTYTVNSDGTFTINGTATSTTYYEITNSFTFDDGVTYMMSGCPSDGASSSYYIIHNASPWNTDYGRGALVNGTGKTVSIQAVVVSGTTCNNLLFKPQIELGSTKTSFEPYTNGASPNPDYPQDVRVVTGNNTINVHGKNLCNFPYYENTKTVNGITFTVKNDGTIHVEGTASARAEFLIRNRDINLSITKGETYTLATSGLGTIDSTLWLDTYGQTGNFLDKWALSRTTTTHTSAVAQSKDIKPLLRIVVANSATVNTDVKVWLYKGSYDETTTYEPYQSQTYPINLGTIELCKIRTYQDYIYKDSGKWYKHSEIGKYVYNNDLQSNGISNYKVGFITPELNIEANQGGPQFSNITYCNMLQTKVVNQTGLSGTTAQKKIRIYLNLNYATTYDEARTIFANGNLTIYYVLATPTNTEITDTTLISQLNAIETYTGTNIFEVSNENNILPDLYVLTEKQNSYKNWKTREGIN